ncbi:replication protein C, IncQ-type [Roseateles sp. BYS96W]|uniref:Replication protein C, IncQ-type n=1 Tax=Pelomonas nitida TaxID=3299027 RepID=A0ABW7GCY1_9BURK
MLPSPDPTLAVDDAHLPAAAKLDRCIVLLDGLFRSVRKDSAARPQVSLEKQFSAAKLVVTYVGPQLAVDDLRTLQALLAIASDAVEHDPPAGDRTSRAPLILELSYRRLGQVAGHSSAGSGPVTRRLEASVARLCEGVLSRRDGRATLAVGEPLLSHVEPGDAGLRRAGLRVRLHPELARAARAGRRGSHYLQLSMTEVRLLKGESARLIHHRLCHLNRGEELEHGLDTLVSYLSGVESSALTRHQWRHGAERVREAIEELVRVLGWGVSDAGVNAQGVPKFLIHRPA